MADISKIKVLDGTEYNIKDATAREELQNKANVTSKQVTGAIASFSDGADGIPVKDLAIDIDPVQDLHGYTNPWPAGGNINAMPPATAKTETVNGITIKTDGDGIYTLSGTSNGEVSITFPLTTSFVIPSGNPETGTHSVFFMNSFFSSSVSLSFMDGSTAVDSWTMSPINRTSVGYNVMSNKNCDSIKFTIPSGVTVNGTVSPMLVPKGTSETVEFTPYSNICPISGFTGANVTRTGKNLYQAKNYSSLPSDGIVYPAGLSEGAYVTENMVLPAGTYTFSMKLLSKPSTARTFTFSGVSVNFANLAALNLNQLYKYTVTISEEMTVYARLWGTGGESFKVQMQIELGSTATDYEPYTGETISVSWQSSAGTVYGGTLDVTTGVLTVDRKRIVATDKTWTFFSSQAGGAVYTQCDDTNDTKTTDYPDGKRPILSNIVPYSANGGQGTMSWGGAGYNNKNIVIILGELTSLLENWNTYISNNTVEFVYYIPEQTYNLTPAEVTTLLGENNMWGDTNGDMTVNYYTQNLEPIIIENYQKHNITIASSTPTSAKAGDVWFKIST